VGDKWTLLIIRDLAAGPRRFVELQRVLPPGMLEPPPGLSGTVELVVEARGDLPERRFQLELGAGHASITERDKAEREPDARVSGPVSAWVAALSPDGSPSELTISGPQPLVDAVLGAFATAATRRAAAAA
jgi:hypothetical protein